MHKARGVFMDIVLERILSLLPKKTDGNFVRGSKKDFATSIGYDSGDIVSMWINGSSTSYNGKLHEIADEYNVSVEWLKGESEQKEKPTIQTESEPFPGYSELTEDEKQKVSDYIALLLAARQKQ